MPSGYPLSHKSASAISATVATDWRLKSFAISFRSALMAGFARQSPRHPRGFMNPDDVIRTLEGRAMDTTEWTVRGSDGSELTPLLISIPQAMRLTGLGRSKIYQKLESGEIESVHVDARRLIPYDAVVRFVAELRGGDQ